MFGAVGLYQVEMLVFLFRSGWMSRSKAFETFYCKHHASIYKLVYRYVGNHHDTENIVQDLFLELLEQFDGLSESNRFVWIYQKAQNRRRNFIRGENRRGKREHHFYEASAQHQAPSDFERRDLILRALMKMSPDKASLLELTHLSKLSKEEIAEVMGIQLSSLSKLQKRAEKYFLQAYESLTKGGTGES